MTPKKRTSELRKRSSRGEGEKSSYGSGAGEGSAYSEKSCALEVQTLRGDPGTSSGGGGGASELWFLKGGCSTRGRGRRMIVREGGSDISGHRVTPGRASKAGLHRVWM